MIIDRIEIFIVISEDGTLMGKFIKDVNELSLWYRSQKRHSFVNKDRFYNFPQLISHYMCADFSTYVEMERYFALLGGKLIQVQ
jgi:hypothetical protein